MNELRTRHVVGLGCLALLINVAFWIAIAAGIILLVKLAFF